MMANAQRRDDEGSEMSWSAWYAEAREEMAFRYGLRRIATDTYKVERALGSSPTQAAKNIYEHMHASGDDRLR